MGRFIRVALAVALTAAVFVGVVVVAVYATTRIKPPPVYIGDEPSSPAGS